MLDKLKLSKIHRYDKGEIASLYNKYQNIYICRYSECKTPLQDVNSDTKITELKAKLKSIAVDVASLTHKLNELPRKRNSADKK